MGTPVEDIKERLSIEEVVGAYVKLERAGKNFKARCPFHHEKTASFFVSPTRNSFHCFGCGIGGDIFSFVEQMEGLDFKGALTVLAERAGVTLARLRAGESDARARLFAVSEEAARFFEEQLTAHQEAQKYCAGRGLKKETIAAWRVGFAPDDWRALRARLISRGFSDVELFRAGLIKHPSEKKGDPFDVFRNRIMFPIFDSAGRVVAFSGRILGAEAAHIPKYLNTPETELWNKSRTLYGMHAAKQGIRERSFALLVEGQVDLLLCHQAGYKNAVATSGTSLTEEHLDLLRRFSDNLLLAYDADRAGERAALRAAPLALRKGFAVKIAALSGKDPAEIIAKNPKDFAVALTGSQHIVRFFLERALSADRQDARRARTVRERLLSLRTDVFPFVRDIASALERAEWIKEIAEKLGVREEAVREEMERLPRADAETETPAANTLAVRNETLRRLAGIVFWQEKAAESEREIDAEKLKKELAALSPEAQSALEAIPKTERDALVFEVEARLVGGGAVEKEARLLLLHLEEGELKKRFTDTLDELADAERKKTEEGKIKEILIRCQTLSARLSEIKRLSAE